MRPAEARPTTALRKPPDPRLPIDLLAHCEQGGKVGCAEGPDSRVPNPLRDDRREGIRSRYFGVDGSKNGAVQSSLRVARRSGAFALTSYIASRKW
jgi:hypothetical protein